jgi:RNA polymerase sigma factor (sigma-70 family)
LPDRQRAAVVLRFYEDLSYAEIADLLHCAEATARSSVHRALATLKATLSKEGAEDA